MSEVRRWKTRTPCTDGWVNKSYLLIAEGTPCSQRGDEQGFFSVSHVSSQTHDRPTVKDLAVSTFLIPCCWLFLVSQNRGEGDRDSSSHNVSVRVMSRALLGIQKRPQGAGGGEDRDHRNMSADSHAAAGRTERRQGPNENGRRREEKRG